MSKIVINPNIEGLEPESIKENMYIRMYNSFFNAQIQKSPSNPNGISEGDDTSIALKNSAFTFADIIGDSIQSGADGVEIDVSNLVKRSGDSMVGELLAEMGFVAGEKGATILSTFLDKDGNKGVDIDGIVRISGSMLLNGKDVLSRNGDTTTINDESIIIDSKNLIIRGDDVDISGFKFTPDGNISFKDSLFYHSNNSNSALFDWASKNMMVSKLLSVLGGADISGDSFTVSTDRFNISGAIRSNNSSGIDIDKTVSFNSNVLVKGKEIFEINGDSLAVGYEDGMFVIGTDKTKEVRLNKSLKSWNGALDIVSNTGYGKFNGFEAGFNSSEPLIKTADGGIIFLNKIWLDDKKDISLLSNGKKLLIGINGGEVGISYLDSTSKYKPLNRPSKTHFLSTTGDFISFDKDFESKAINIHDSETRIEDKKISLTKTNYIESADNSSIIHGDIKVLDVLSSRQYASGYGGNGWVIMRDALSGMTSMSIDEMTVRRKMRIYELEVQTIKATNGSLWVSDSMAADTVEQII